MLRYKWLCICFLLLNGCASTSNFDRVTYGTEWKDGRKPKAETLRACAEYGQIASSYTVQGYSAPPVNQVVEIKPARPTEYEGEITSCGISTCNVVLRETRRSALNRQITDTSNNLSKGAYEAGYAIGAAIRANKKRRQEEEAREVATNECLLMAGYEKQPVRYAETGIGLGTCTLEPTKRDGVGSQTVPVSFRNFTNQPTHLYYLRPNGTRKSYGVLRPYQQRNYTTRKGHVWELSSESSGKCLSRVRIDDDATKTMMTLVSGGNTADDPYETGTLSSQSQGTTESNELKRHFLEVALGVVASGNDSTKLKKWMSPIKVRVIGDDRELKSELFKLVDEINALTHRNFVQIASASSEYNYTVVLASPNLYSFYAPKASKTTKASGWVCAWNSWQIQNCTIFVNPNSRESKKSQRSLLRRQFSVTLGLMEYSTSLRDSVFYKDYSRTTSYSEEDTQLIKWLYDHRLKPGMSAAEIQTSLFDLLVM